MPAKRANALEELATLGLIDERHETVADFEADFVELEQRFDLLLGVRLLFPADDFRGLCFFGADLRSYGSKIRGDGGEKEKRKFWEARDQAQQEHDTGSNLQRHAATEKLAGEIGANGFTAGSASDDDATCNGDEERGDKGYEAVAHSENGVGFGGFGERDVELENADEEAGDDVDGGDEDSGESVTLAEAGRAVHGAIKLGFLGDHFAAGAGLRFVDHASVHFGVDGHLLAGESVQSETGGDFGGTDRAVVDDKVLNGDERKEDDEADDVVAADDELSEGLDDAAGGVRALRAVKENAAATGDVDGDAEEREEKKERGKNGKLYGAEDVERGEEDDDAESDAEGEENVEDDGGDGDEHHENGGDGGDGDEPFERGVAFRHGGSGGHFLAGSCGGRSAAAGVHAHLRAVEEGENFGDRGVKIWRDHLVDLGGFVQGLG